MNAYTPHAMLYRVHAKLQDAAKSTHKTKTKRSALKKGEIQCREKGRRDRGRQREWEREAVAEGGRWARDLTRLRLIAGADWMAKGNQNVNGNGKGVGGWRMRMRKQEWADWVTARVRYPSCRIDSSCCCCRPKKQWASRAGCSARCSIMTAQLLRGFFCFSSFHFPF